MSSPQASGKELSDDSSAKRLPRGEPLNYGCVVDYPEVISLTTTRDRCYSNSYFRVAGQPPEIDDSQYGLTFSRESIRE